ncbi:MAG: hypothetical protein ABI876_07345 [Bacteroidota bacterium]
MSATHDTDTNQPVTVTRSATSTTAPMRKRIFRDLRESAMMNTII